MHWDQFVSIGLAGTAPESLSHHSSPYCLKMMPVSQYSSLSLFFFLTNPEIRNIYSGCEMFMQAVKKIQKMIK